MKDKLTIQDVLKNLPIHMPAAGLWDRIEIHLPSEAILSSLSFPNDPLPERIPPGTVWNSIEHELDKRNNRKLIYIPLLVAAALFAVYVGLEFLVPLRKPVINSARLIGRTDIQLNISKQQKSTFAEKSMAKSEKSTGKLSGARILGFKSQLPSIVSSPHNASGIQKVSNQAMTLRMLSDTGKNMGRVMISRINEKLMDKEQIMTLSEPKWKPLKISPGTRNPLNIQPLAKMDESTGKVKEVSIPSDKGKENKNINHSTLVKTRFALGLNYQSEPYDNGINRTTLRNLAVNVTAKTSRWQFYSGVGYAYAIENSPGDRQDKMAYSGAGYGSGTVLVNSGSVLSNSMDALSAATQNLPDAASRQLFTNLVSSPVPVHHPYLTYDLGTSVKLFGNKSVNGWVTGGTGFSVKLDRQTSREKEIVSINSLLIQQQSQYSLPYNSYRVFNMDINAGFQLGYQFTKRLTLLMEPSVNFLVVPIFSGYFNHSDLFSLGLKTGLRINLKK